jgi:transposase
MAKTTRYPQELHERAVRRVAEHRAEYPSKWTAISSIAGKFEIIPETL